MPSIQQLWEFAQISQASYYNLQTTTVDGVRASINTFYGIYQFSKTQADKLIDGTSGFSIVDLSANANNAVGFSATLFKDNRSDGQYVLAFRGTEPLADFPADAIYSIGQISNWGIAPHQIVSAYNYFKQLVTPAGESTQQLGVEFLLTIPTDGRQYVPVASPLGGETSPLGYLALTRYTASVGIGALANLPAGTKINLTGHSLGGHLAQAMQRLFPQWVDAAYVQNTAGFYPTNADNFLRMIDPAIGDFDNSKIQNIYSYNGGEYITNTMVHTQYGERIGVAIEDQMPTVTGNHSGVLQARSLALHALFERVQPGFDTGGPIAAPFFSKIDGIIRAMAPDQRTTYEATLRSSVKLFLNQNKTIAELEDLETFYQNLYTVRDAIDVIRKSSSISIVGLVALTAAQDQAPLSDSFVANLIEGATGALDATHDVALAYRYALQELNPFIITGSEALYAPHNTGINAGKLDLYNATERTGTLTPEWIEDRAAFLAWKNLAYTADAPATNSGVVLYRTPQGSQPLQFVDVAQKINLGVVLPGAGGIALENARRYAFGGDAADFVAGSVNPDRLYGGAGADQLRGRQGNDYLEGGSGMDVYEYFGRKGVGGVLGNDGEDVVLDTDGKGVLRYVFDETGILGSGGKVTSGIIRDASVQKPDGSWQSADGKFSYQRSQSDLVVTINGDAGGRITLKNFRDGDYGIYLFESQRSAPAMTQPLILGDRLYRDFNLATPELDIQFDDRGNIIVTEEVVPDVPDTLYGDRPATAAAPDAPGQLILSGGGNDTVLSDRPNGVADNGMGDVDRIDAGAGRDVVEAGAGNDWVTGGADGEAMLGGTLESGGDVISGGLGNDVLFGDTETTLAAAIQAANTGPAGNATGDFISGGSGSDWVLGGAGRNIMLGGDGDDIVVGGAGNDNLLGDDNRVATSLYWFVNREVASNAGGGNTYRLQFGGVSGDAGGADGRDALYGGKGDDWIFAGGGDDFIDGGSDKDVLFGNGGADFIVGGSEDDVLIGDSGAGVDVALQGGDVLDGGDGNDELQGDSGDDVLLGGAGVDTLRGGEGNDILNGGKGNDIIVKGPGDDLIIYDRGDGEDVIVPVSASGDHRASLVFGEGIKRSDIKFRLGSLMIDLGPSNPEDTLAGNDRIHFEGFDPSNPSSTPVLESIQFADGEVMAYEDILAQGFDLDGTGGDDIIDGTAVTDRINSLDGNDVIFASGGDDVLDAGEGDDDVDAGSGNDTVNAGAGDDDAAGGDGNDVIDGGMGHDQLAGGTGADQLLGGDGDDFIDGGAGNDVLAGDAGIDAYRIYGGMGSDVVVDSETGETSILQLAGGMSLDNLTASREGDSLHISLRGLDDDAVLISDFYSRPQDWLIRDADGNVATMETLLARPDPAGDFVSGLWNDFRQGQVARVAGLAQTIGWQSAGGFVFSTIQEQAYIEGIDQTTIETFTQVSEPFGVLAVNNTRLAQEVVQGFGVSDGQNFKWFQQSFEAARQESDAALIIGAGGSRSQTQTALEAMLTLKRDGRVFNVQRNQSSESGGVVSYDTGTEVVLAAVSYEYDNQSYNRLASVSQISTSLLDQTPNVLYGNRVRVEATQFTDHFRYIDEIIGGASANRIQVSSGNPSYLFQSIALVDGGAGNDTISGNGSGHLLYGNSGNDVISGSGSLLIGGDGDDRLTGLGGSRFAYTATETGIDQLSENSIYTNSYIDWYYRSLGIGNWEVRAEHAGEYEVAVEGDGFSYRYYATYEEAFAEHPAGIITYIEALPELPIIQRKDATTLSTLAAAGVLAQDTVLFGPGVALDDLTLTVAANDELPSHAGQPSSGGGILSVRWGDAGFDVAIPDLHYGFSGVLDDYRLGEGVELFEFADGTRMTLDELLAAAAVRFEYVDGSIHQIGSSDSDSLNGDHAGDTLIGRAGDDWLFGYSGDDFLDGGEGNDFLRGDGYESEAGNDILLGGAGDDILSGGDGDDVLEGGPGDDAPSGGEGADRIVFGPGDGFDELNVDAEDIVEMAAPLTPENVLFSRINGFDLLVKLRGSDDQMIFTGWFEDNDINFEPANAASGFEFSGGIFLSAAQVESRLEVTPATEGDDLVGVTNGNDVVDALGGNDEIYNGSAGIDIIRAGAGDDYLEHYAGAGLLDGGADNDTFYNGGGSQFIIGGAGDDYIYLYGGATPSIVAFNPGDGADTVYAAADMTLSIGGGIGVNDLTLSQDAESGELILSVGADDSIRLSRLYEEDPQAWPQITLQLFGSAHLYDFSAAIAAFHDSGQGALPLGDVLPALQFEVSEFAGLGGRLANEYQLHGTLDGLSDAEILEVVSAAGFGSELQPLASGLTLSGTDAADTVTGGPGNDFIDGLAGADRMLGGEGDDSYMVDQTGDKVVELPDQGHDVVSSSVNYTLSAEVEDLLLSGTANLNGTGNALANTITGNSGANRLDGKAGADVLIGGAGNDVYVIDNEQDSITELADEGTDTVQSPFDFTLAEHFENLTLTGFAVSGTGNAVANRLTGNALDNLLSGLDGNDVLNGAAGADILIGGAGNDTYVVDHGGDQVIELADEGVDTVQATTSYGLAGEIENLTLTGTAAIDGTGNALDNRLTGNAAANTLTALDGDDRLDGKAGADLLVGGAGNDIYYVDQTDDAVLELADEGVDVVNSAATFALSAEVENLTLTGTAAIDGSGNAGANVLTGNAADNRLEGLEGDDVLDGKAGADVLAGGAGNDRFIVDQAADITIEMADEGIDTVQAALTWTLGEHIEQLTLTGAALIDGTGNAADNVLTGNNAANMLTGLDGNDWLDGKGGSDTLIGGAGDDTHVVAQSGDVVIELAGEGVDTVRAGITWTLGEELENLVLTGTAGICAVGNALANILTGNSGNNLLDGLAGADLMIGGTGNDTYMVDDAGDQSIESAGEGVDWVKAVVSYALPDEVENLTLTGTAAIDGTGNALGNAITGNAAINTLTGGAGNDALNGGAGADMLLGGTGDDFYTVDNAGDVVIELADEGIDTVNTSITHALADHVENLALTGSGNRNATGNALDNILAGNRGINILNGMAGNDTLAGGPGNDSYRFDPGFGHDVIAENDATAGNLDRIQFGTGITATDITLGRLDDDLVAHTADQQHSIRVLDWFSADAHRIERIDFADGASWDMAAIESQAMQMIDMPGLQRGNDSASTLLGRIGNTILEGNGGSDVLTDGDGNNLYSSGSGDDVATGGDGNDLFAGGAGNDTHYTGAGSNVIAYNAGGGIDTVYAQSGAQNTLSLGGGLGYSGLALSRDSNDLVLNTGADDRIVLKDWYAGNNNLLNLQVILDASDEFDAGAADPLYNRRVQNFDFLGMVSAFDAAQAANPGISLWALGDALTQYHLSAADDAALGGDLAYWYARNGGFTGIGMASAQQIIGAPGFGAEAQGLREFSGLQEGLVRLG